MGSRHLLGRLIATAVLIGALVAVASVFAAATERSDLATLQTQAFAVGALSQSNSDDGTAIFAVSNFAPGHSTEGTVTISNTGTDPGTLALSMSDLTDSPGTNGGALSAVLDLQITDISFGSEVYSGKLAEMPEQQLATLLPSDSRTYRFTATLPDNGAPVSDWTDDNLYQQATTSVSYDWVLTQTGSGETGPGLVLPPEQGTRSDVFTFGNLKPNGRNGRATLAVHVPGPGRLHLSGKGARILWADWGTGAGGAVTAAGTVKLLIKAKGKSRIKLDKAGKVKVKVKVTFTPTGGASNTQSLRVELIKKG
jgi:spore coat-associated protein N